MCFLEGPSWPRRPSVCRTAALALAPLSLVGERAEMGERAETAPPQPSWGKGLLGRQVLAAQHPRPGLSSTPLPQVWSDKQLRRRPLGTLTSMGQTPPTA